MEAEFMTIKYMKSCIYCNYPQKYRSIEIGDSIILSTPSEVYLKPSRTSEMFFLQENCRLLEIKILMNNKEQKSPHWTYGASQIPI